MTERARTRGVLTLTATAVLALSACSGGADADEGSRAASTEVSTSGTVFDESTVHTFDVEIDEDDFQAMIATYLDSGDKEWISGTVTIDGEQFTDVGLKLKGNSSLMGVTADTEPETLPWRIQLDEFVEDQSLDGYSDFVVRANSSETALNEAVALDLLEAADLASTPAVSTTFSVNGSEADLRLVVQNLDDDWDSANFDGDGVLFKADADGDYSYRGEDAAAYTEAFEVEAGEEDYQPLIDFLDFVNNSSDEDFAADLDSYLDVEAFARYLAFEDLISNFDDIDGPGNNSFLRWDASTGLITVVAWDHNLAFGGFGQGGFAGGGQGGGQGDGTFPEGFTPPTDGSFPEGFTPPTDGSFPEGFTPPTDGELPEGFTPPEAVSGQGGPMGRSNALVTRFKADADFTALYDEALASLKADLVDSGVAADILSRRVDTLQEQASDLVDTATIESDADQIEAVLSGEDS